MTLDKSSVDGIGKGELGQVLSDIVLLLVELELRSVAESVFGEDLENIRLEGKSGNVLVVDEVDLVELDARLDDLVSNGSSVGESGDVLADLVERESKVLGEDTTKLGLGLLTKNDNSGALGRVGGTGSLTELLEFSLGALGDGRVDTTAKTLVGGDNDEELTTALGSNGLGVGEDLWNAGIKSKVGKA